MITGRSEQVRDRGEERDHVPPGQPRIVVREEDGRALLTGPPSTLSHTVPATSAGAGVGRACEARHERCLTHPLLADAEPVLLRFQDRGLSPDRR